MLLHIDKVHPHYDCPVIYCHRKWRNGFSSANHLIEHLRAYHHWDIPEKRDPKEGEELESLRQKCPEITAENATLGGKVKELEEENAELKTTNEWLERRVRVLCGVVTDVMRLDDSSAAAAE